MFNVQELFSLLVKVLRHNQGGLLLGCGFVSLATERPHTPIALREVRGIGTVARVFSSPPPGAQGK